MSLGKLGRHTRAFAVAGVLVLAAASDDPPRPVGAMPLDPPPPVYASWWQEAQECTGRRTPMRHTHFWIVQGFLNYPAATGLWKAPHEIYVLRVHRYARGVVAHEMLHDLLHDGGHESPCFARLSVE